MRSRRRERATDKWREGDERLGGADARRSMLCVSVFRTSDGVSPAMSSVCRVCEAGGGERGGVTGDDATGGQVGSRAEVCISLVSYGG